MRLFYRLALLQDAPAISRFYMWEAYAQLERMHDYADLDRDDFLTLIRIMAAVDLQQLALLTLDERIATHPEFRQQKMALEFASHHYPAVLQLMHQLDATDVQLDEHMPALLRYWRRP